MASTFEVWLTDDAGKRLQLLKNLYFLSYTRSTAGLGTVNFGLPFKDISLIPYFKPDWRVEVWRSAAYGVPMRREDVYLLRKPNVYTRDDDVQVLQFYGRNGLDLLNRRSVIQRAGTSWASKTDQVDDMMKAVVREQMLYGSALDEDGVADNSRAWPQNEFTVQADSSLGPSTTLAFAGKSVMDVLRELKQSSFQLNMNSSANKRILFDVLPLDLPRSGNSQASPLGWQFTTFADLRGSDRTDGIEFSLANENITNPIYSLNHLEEWSSVIVNGNGQGLSQLIEIVSDTTRINASRWNRVEKVVTAHSETTTAGLQNAGYPELHKGAPEEKIDVTLLNTPGSNSTPRSLYGVDWDLGDLVRVNYANKRFNVEIVVVYVSVDENGKETITGRNEVSG